MIEPFDKPIYVTQPFFPPLDEFIEKLKEIWDSKYLTNMGPQHKTFEKLLKDYLNVQHLTLFVNGTIALQIALQALEIKGEVITTPFTFPATINSIILSNCKPIFCDISTQDYNIDPNKIEDLINNKTTAIMPVHVFGNPCDINEIDKIAKKHNLKVIYDAAHCFGVKYNDKCVGMYGDLSMYSFHATKLFHTIEGGALIYTDKELEEKLYLWKNFGIRNEDDVLLPGINGKMNEIQAAMGITNLKHMSQEFQKRKSLFSLYKEQLSEVIGINLIKYRENTTPNYQYFPIRINEKNFGLSRDGVYELYKKFNVFTRKYFHPLGTEYEFMKKTPNEKLMNSKIIANEILCLPIFSELKDNDVVKICNILKNEIKPNHYN